MMESTRRGAAVRRLTAGVALLVVICLMSGLPAVEAAPSDGSITGIVTDASSSPVVGVTVTAYGDSTSRSAVTAVDGTYTISDAPAGSYVVSFVPLAGSSLMSEYYAGQTTFASANQVVVSAGGLASNVNAALKEGGTISGRVVDSANVPVPGVVVSTFDYYFSNLTATTAADGTYSISGLRSGDYLVQFTPPQGSNLVGEYYNNAANWTMATAVAVAGGGAVLIGDTVLDAGGTITGTVTSSTGPVAGANVMIGSRQATTAADGTYSIAGIQPGVAIPLRFSGPTSGPDRNLFPEYWNNSQDFSAATMLTLVAGEVRTGIDAELARGGTISGTVTGPSGPVLGALVYALAEPYCGQYCYAAAYTDASGAYALGPIGAGTYRVTFQPPPSNPAGLISEVYNDQSLNGTPNLVTVGAGASVASVDAVLGAGASITGTVSSAAGPAPDVWVSLQTPAGGYVSTAITGVTGGYSFAGVTPGSYKLRFTPNLYGASKQLVGEWFDDAASVEAASVITVGSGGTATADASLRGPGSVQGRVTRTSDGAPLESMTVTAFSNEFAVASVTAQTAGDGTYTINGLIPGSYSISVSDAGGAYVNAWSQATVVADTATTGIDFSLRAAGAVSGTVTDEDTGEPVAGLEVTVMRPTGASTFLKATTDSQGRYRISGMTAGVYALQVSDPIGHHYFDEWYHDATGILTATLITVDESVVSADMEVKAGSTITGRVTDATTGDGVSYANVGSQSWEFGAKTDLTGTYRLGPLAPGSYKLKMSTPNGQYLSSYYGGADESSAAAVDVEGSEIVTGIDVALLVGAEINGVVTDASTGAPVAAASVRLIDIATGNEVEYGQTDGVGAYSLRGIPAGSYAIRTTSPSYPTQFHDHALTLQDVGPIIVASQSNVTQDIELLAGIVLSGVATDVVTGQPVSACLTLYPDEGGAPIWTCTGSTGQYTVSLAPGSYYTYVRSSTHVGESMFITVGDTNVVQNLELDEGARVRFRLRDKQTGVGVFPVSVRFDRVDGGTYYVGGTYASDWTSEPVPPGDYRIYFDVQGRYVDEWWNDAATSQSANVVSLAAGESGIFEVDFTLGGTLSGTITDQGGAALSGACVEVLEPSTDALVALGCTGASGLYTLTGVRPGNWKVRFTYQGQSQFFDGTRSSAEATTVAVGADELVSGVDAVFLTGGVTGIVTDSTTSDPIAGACAYLYTGDAVLAGAETGLGFCTDASGYYAFAPLAPGTYTVAVVDPAGQHAAATGTVTIVDGSGMTVLDLGLQPVGSRLTGRVLAAGTGTPINGACVYVYAESDAARTTSLGATCTGTDGSYRLDLPGAAGTSVIAVGSDPEARYLATSGPPVVLTGTVTQDLTMAAGASIAGRATDSATQGPVAGACLYLYSVAGDPSGFATCVRPDGYYAVSGVPAGTYKVGVTDMSGEHLTYWSGGGADLASASTVTIVDGAVTSFNAPMGQVTGLSVSVVDTDASLVELGIDGVCLYLYDLTDSYTGRGSCSNSQGRIALDAPSGSYKGALFDPQGRFLTTWLGGASIDTASTATIGSGRVEWPKVELTGLGSISGRFTDANDQPVAGVAIYLGRPDGSYSGLYGTTGADGSYTISGVPEGQYKAGFYPAGMGSPTTIWFGGESETTATLITVRTGQITGDISANPPVT